jgi:hypothetical protein
MEEDPARLIQEIRSAHLTYCGFPKLENISAAVGRVIREGIAGDFIEAGVALGGSAMLLGRLKSPNVTLRLYDVFAMIPPPGDEDGQDAHRRYEVIQSGASEGLGPNAYYGYTDALMEKVLANLTAWGLSRQEHRIELIPGLYQDTLYPPAPVAFAHIDCDWYASVRTCIERIVPLLARGGIIVFDDYGSYSGCRKAVDEFIRNRPDMELIFHQRSIGFRRI